MPLFKGFFVSLQSIRGYYASIISTIVDERQSVNRQVQASMLQ